MCSFYYFCHTLLAFDGLMMVCVTLQSQLSDDHCYCFEYPLKDISFMFLGLWLFFFLCFSCFLLCLMMFILLSFVILVELPPVFRKLASEEVVPSNSIQYSNLYCVYSIFTYCHTPELGENTRLVLCISVRM